jgi:AcrR family transcriptional regulator
MVVKNKKNIERTNRHRDKILRVAVRLFWQKSFLGTSIDDIAKAANINKATIYYYFESKSSILYEIIMDHVNEIYEEALPVADSSESPENKLASLIANNLKLQILHPGRAVLSHREWRELPLKLRRSCIDKRKKYAAIFTEIIKEIIDNNGEPVINTKLFTLFTFGLVNSMVHWYKPDGQLPSDEIVSQAVTYIMRVLSHHVKFSDGSFVLRDLVASSSRTISST